MPDSVSAVTSSLSFAKLVATPTDTAWSQAYNAGNIFVCLTLLKPDPSDTIALQPIGKESINIFESEFFTLEHKSIEGIKEALEASLENIPPEVKSQLTVAHFKDDLLTVFIAGSGKVVMKRDEKIGILLEKHDTEDVTSAAGYVKHGDTILLESGDFAKIISEQTIQSALELPLPNDIVETLSPKMHEHAQGGESAIVITFQSSHHPSHVEETNENPEEQTLAALYESKENMVAAEPINLETPEYPDEHEQIPLKETFSDQLDNKPHNKRFTLPTFHLPQVFSHNRLTHRKKLYLTIAIIIAVLLLMSIFMAMKKQTDSAQKALFTSIYSQANQYYEEGQGLATLNQSLSQDSYKRAEQKIHEADGKIAKGSDEDNQLQALLTKVHAAQTGSGGGNSSKQSEKEVTPKSFSLLAVEKDNKNGLAFGQDDRTVYMVDEKAITLVSKNAGTKKVSVKNNNDWESPKAIAPYQGNLYVLDQSKGVLKYVGGSTKSSYFSSDAPDLSKATGMAIDGSIWIVTSDGKLMKYTRGKKDSLGLTGFDKSLSKPTKLFTSIDMDYVYILDNGNNRIVKIDKKGAFQKSIVSPIIAQAKDFDVIESESKVYIIANDKVYEFPL